MCERIYTPHAYTHRYRSGDRVSDNLFELNRFQYVISYQCSKSANTCVSFGEIAYKTDIHQAKCVQSLVIIITLNISSHAIKRVRIIAAAVYVYTLVVISYITRVCMRAHASARTCVHLECGACTRNCKLLRCGRGQRRRSVVAGRARCQCQCQVRIERAHTRAFWAVHGMFCMFLDDVSMAKFPKSAPGTIAAECALRG